VKAATTMAAVSAYRGAFRSFSPFTVQAVIVRRSPLASKRADFASLIKFLIILNGHVLCVTLGAPTAFFLGATPLE
jgi:hypothetical protein